MSDLTPEERRRWPEVAPWIKLACEQCREQFRQTTEKAERERAARKKAARKRTAA